MELKEALMQCRKKILTLDNVVGIGRGFKEIGGARSDQEAIQVLVQQKLPKSELRRGAIVPEAIQGFPTDVIEIGRIRALGARTEQMRPAMPGISMSHYQVTAGTFGAVVYDLVTGQPLILSNNHILANNSSKSVQRAHRGDPILQPGAYDGGTVEKDIIGYLERYVPLEIGTTGDAHSLQRIFQRLTAHLLQAFHLLIQGEDASGHLFVSPLRKENVVDCAVAVPVNDQDIEDRILSIGTVQGVRTPEIGDRLVKSGRTTGVTRGRVRTLDATVSVEMDEGESAVFRDQIITDLKSDGGDSGALVLDSNRNAVGLLFAGSDEVTVCNPIQPVLDALKVRF